jgi:hypothetical protein
MKKELTDLQNIQWGGDIAVGIEIGYRLDS